MKKYHFISDPDNLRISLCRLQFLSYGRKMMG